ncbi:hypothetical protein KKF55_02790 [Patescibacteria group bacterium]|nr:hypothetical protein [Patescibacteria group bacterium]
MRTSWRWPIILGVSSIVIAVFMQVPQFLHQIHPDSKGVLVTLNSDEHYYLARVQEALSGRGEQASEAFVGDPDIVGTQLALIERLYGVLFYWTGLRASGVFQVMDSVLPVLIFLGLFFFFQLCGFTRKQALFGAILFVVIEAYNLNRPIHMRASFFAMLMTLICIAAGITRRRSFGILGGVLLGVLIGVYFWSWSFAWLWWGIYFVWELGEFVWQRRVLGVGRGALGIWKKLLIIGVVGLVAALPFIWNLYSVMQHPLSEYGVFRSGMHPSRMPESWIYSALFAVMTVGVLMTVRKRYEQLRPYRAGIVTVLTAFGFMNQQVIHGTIFMFVSHSIFSLLLAPIVVLLLAWTLRTKWMIIAALAACIYLAGIGYDGRYVLGQWTVIPGRFADQHFATLLPVLDELPRVRILSDPDSTAFIASYTHHDVVYSIYLKNVLMTHKEIAERFCTLQIPTNPDDCDFENIDHLIHPEANAVFGDPSIRENELKLINEACAEADRDPAAFLKKFDVQYVLWDEKRQPDWDLRRFRVPLEKVVQGEGWSLWGIDS